MDIYSALELTHWRMRDDFRVGKIDNQDSALESRSGSDEEPEPQQTTGQQDTIDRPETSQKASQEASDSGDSESGERKVGNNPKASPVSTAPHASLSNGSASEQAPEPLTWESLEARFEQTDCPVCQHQSNVLHEGNKSGRWLFVVDAPSAASVAEQKLLTGRNRQLFDSILRALQLAPDDIYLSSIFKCAPSDDLSIVSRCQDLLRDEITLLRPSFIVCFGEFASQTLLRSNDSLAQLETAQNMYLPLTIPLISTYSLPEVLQNTALKARLWESLKIALRSQPANI